MFLPGERNQRQWLRWSFNWTGQWTARQMTLIYPVSQPTVNIDDTRVKLVRQLDGAHDSNSDDDDVNGDDDNDNDNKINEEVSLMLSA
jgi:hypothetical protein